jgi:hypothetical protein
MSTMSGKRMTNALTWDREKPKKFLSQYFMKIIGANDSPKIGFFFEIQ